MAAAMLSVWIPFYSLKKILECILLININQNKLTHICNQFNSHNYLRTCKSEVSLDLYTNLDHIVCSLES